MTDKEINEVLYLVNGYDDVGEKMKKWEYNTITVRCDTINGDEMLTRLDESGKDGWELVNIIESKDGYKRQTLQVFLKRELSEDVDLEEDDNDEEELNR